MIENVGRCFQESKNRTIPGGRSNFPDDLVQAENNSMTLDAFRTKKTECADRRDNIGGRYGV